MKIFEERLTKVPIRTVCDITNKQAVASLKLWFGYGSDHDGTEVLMDLDNDTSNAILKLLQDKFGKEKIKSLTNDYLY